MEARPCRLRARSNGLSRSTAAIDGASPPVPARRIASQQTAQTTFASRGLAPTTYSTEVQQRPLTAASEHDRQHTELAGATAKRPAAPLVRDEEARARCVPDRLVNHLYSRSLTATSQRHAICELAADPLSSTTF